MADDAPSPAATETAAPTTATPESPATPSTGVTAPSPSAPSPGESAPSPSAKPTEADSRESLLEAVTQAVPELRSAQTKEGDEAGGASPAPAAKSETTTPPPDDYSDLSDDIPPEELAAYRAGAKRRVDKLLKQRTDLRAELVGKNGELDQLKARMPQAEAAASVQKYLRDNDIGKEDFMLTLELAAAMRRGDFKAFYEGVQPYMRLAEEYLGIQLPGDLQQRVAEGQMTTQAAAMFARERMDRALAESQRYRQAQMYDTQTQTTAQRTLQTNVRDSVNAWEQATMQADADYVTKKPLLQEVMWSVVRERGPRRPRKPPLKSQRKHTGG